MNYNVITKTYPSPTINRKEILYYMGCKSETAEISTFLDSAINEAEQILKYNVCFIELPLEIKNDVCDFKTFSLESKDLSYTLRGCKRVVLFAATIGIGIDRLINRYSRTSPTRSVILSAIGSERIEALCDMFCGSLKTKYEITPRFSAGYGDLSIFTQREIFSLLGCEKNIGLTLNESMLMSPTKSVTAFVGIKKE